MSEAVPRSREELLHLFADYVGEERLRTFVNELALTRHGGFQVPEKVLVILFASRAGSNYLGQLLSGTGWFREIGESFRPSQLIKIRDRHGLADVHDAAQWMIDQRGTPKAFGFKAGFRVLIAAAELGLLSEVLDRARFVLLRRRDRVAQAVSLVKSKLTGRTHSGQPDPPPLSDADYDEKAIAFELGNIDEVEAQYVDFLDRAGLAAREIWYEDVCAAPTEVVNQICGDMQLETPAGYRPDTRVQILRDDLSARWVERFRAAHPTLDRLPGRAVVG